MRIVTVCEGAPHVRDHGVFTAFAQQTGALRRLGHDVRVNDLRAARRAELTIVHSPGPFSRSCLAATRGATVAMGHITPATLHDSLRGERIWREPVRRWLRSLYRSVDLVAAVSEPSRVELLELGVRPAQLRTVSLGIDPPGDLVDVQRTAKRRRPLVLGVGQLQPRKGIDRFAVAAEQLPAADFVWIGGRPFRGMTAGGMSLRRLRRRAPSNCTFTGAVSESELWSLYRSADVFLLPSRQENFGQVVLEAACVGLPLVLSDLPAFNCHFAGSARLAAAQDLPDHVGALIEDRAQHAAAMESARELASRMGATPAARRLLQTVCCG